MIKDEKYSVQVTWTKDDVTKSEIANNYPLSMDEAKLMLQKVRKTVFPKGTTSTFDIVPWKQTD
jgi:hypothetical protein